MLDSFYRIQRLPPYTFNVVNDLKMKLQKAGEDIIDLGMGNPDLPTPPHIVEKLIADLEDPGGVGRGRGPRHAGDPDREDSCRADERRRPRCLPPGPSISPPVTSGSVRRPYLQGLGLVCLHWGQLLMSWT